MVITFAVMFSSFLLQNREIKNQTKIPEAMPVEIDDDKVISKIVKKAGVA